MIPNANGIIKVVEVWTVDYDTVVEGLTPLFCMAISMTKYLNVIIQKKKFQDTFMSIKNDTARLANHSEQDVLQKFAMQGRIHVLRSSAYYTISLVLYLLASITTIAYYETHPVNGTVIREIMYPMELYVDQTEDRYYYVITLHCYMTTVLTLYTIAALDSLYIILTQHACALFAVAGFRLKTAHILDKTALRTNKGLESWRNKTFTEDEQNQIHQRVVLSIKEHKRALQYTGLFQSLFSISLFIQLSINVVTLSVTGCQVLAKLGSIHTVVRLGTLLVGQLFHLFLICLPGQRLVNYSDKLHYDSMDCIWYSFTKKTNVLYHILSTNSMTPCKLIALKMIPLNMETYLAVTKTAVSYFTVLTSSR